MKKLIHIVILFAWQYNSHAQPTQAWLSRFNNQDERGKAITFDPQGSVYVAGSTYDTAAGTAFVTIKYSSSGIQQWVAYYNGPADYDDIPAGITVDGSGNVYVTGSSAVPEGGPSDYATVKYNSAGVEQWVARYNGPGNGSDFPIGIGLDVAGNIYVSGTSRGLPSGNDIATIKYNSAGVQQWVARYRGPGWPAMGFGPNANAYALHVSSNGTVHVTGLAPYVSTGIDFVTVKYNTDGMQQWFSTYAGPTNNIPEFANVIDVDDAGNVYVSGDSPVSLSDIDLATIKYNENGVQQWARRYDFISSAYAIRTNGAVHIVTGTRILKLDKATGDTLWTRTKGGDSEVSIDQAGNVYTAGSRLSSTVSDLVIIKYDASGQFAWQHVYSSPNSGQEGGDGISADNSGNVYVTGHSPDGGVGSDIVTLRLTQPVSSADPGGTFPGSFALHQNYPNPFNPSTRIRFRVPHSNFVMLKVFDLMGSEVVALVNEVKSAGMHEAIFDATHLANGVYLYQLTAGEFREAKKLVLLK